MSLWDKALQKRLDYGSSGHQAPVVPHVPKSARGKRSVRKKVEDNQMYAFDLLATVAGELLSGRENSLSPCNNAGKSNPVEARDTVKEEQTDKEKLFKFAAFDRLSCNEDILDPESVSEKNIAYNLKENPKASKASAPASPFVKSDLSDEEAIGLESKFIGDGGKSGYSVGAVDEKYGKGRLYSSYVISHECKEDGTKTRLQVEMRVGGNSLAVTDQYIYSSEDPMVLDAKSPASVSSDSSVEVSRHRSNFSHNSLFPKQEDGMDLAVNKDDDENSSGCTHPAVVTNKTSRMQHIGDRRIRKLLASKLRKVAPTTLQDGEMSNYDVEQKPSLRGKRMCYTRQRTQRSSFKRRKLFDHYPVSASDGGIYSEGVSNLCDKGRIKLETNDLHANLCGVKLSIKSFKVPELVIEIPETATVGSLKRTVLEAVTSILGGGLRVGVLQQGKKVRDDNKTLRQVGITHGDKLDNLGFTLEPNPGQASTPLTSSEDPHFPGLGCAPEPLARIPPITPVVVDQGVPDATQSVQTSHESDQDSVCSPTDASSQEKTTSNSLALAAVPPMNVEALATVPFHNKPKRSESTQRRVRRPFSVAEVEALVQAVEKLGTGRWRDVKLRAFEDAKHRTYVDLKDKWKTLVHTARISPQQRRGEPVPQELLDRVLSAHAYWSQQQAKLLLKPPPSADTSLLL